jgi:hypothetical protein
MRPRVISRQDVTATIVIPSLSINAPPNGASKARIRNMMPIAVVTSEMPHPKEVVIGKIRT